MSDMGEAVMDGSKPNFNIFKLLNLDAMVDFQAGVAEKLVQSLVFVCRIKAHTQTKIFFKTFLITEVKSAGHLDTSNCTTEVN